jgi:hypothetical protein
VNEAKIYAPEAGVPSGREILRMRISYRTNFFGALTLAALTFGFTAHPAAAQGPAGAGAAVAAGGSSSRSYSPVKLFSKKKAEQPDPAAAAPVANEELDARLETKLRASQVLAPDATLKTSCVKFLQRVDCLAALHATHNLGLNFDCVKSNVTGIRVDADTSSCRMPSGDKPLSLANTIKLLKPDANAKSAAKDAETVAREELKEAGA